MAGLSNLPEISIGLYVIHVMYVVIASLNSLYSWTVLVLSLHGRRLSFKFRAIAIGYYALLRAFRPLSDRFLGYAVITRVSTSG